MYLKINQFVTGLSDSNNHSLLAGENLEVGRSGTRVYLALSFPPPAPHPIVLSPSQSLSYALPIWHLIRVSWQQHLPPASRLQPPSIEGVVNTTENKQKSPKVDAHIYRPIEEYTPPNFVPFCEELEVELSFQFHSISSFSTHKLYISSRGTSVHACDWELYACSNGDLSKFHSVNVYVCCAIEKMRNFHVKYLQFSSVKFLQILQSCYYEKNCTMTIRPCRARI